MGKGEDWNIENYEGIVNNYKKGKEGLAVAVQRGTFISIEKVSEGYENILSVSIKYPETSLRVIVCHGPQEDDETEVRHAFFENLAVEVERSHAADEIPVLVGDMNAKISLKDNEISANSFNGKMLREMLVRSELNVVNFQEKAIGKWTRIQVKKKEVIKSVLDYVLVDDVTNSRVVDFLVDEEKCMTPFRTTKTKKSVTVTHSDHCMIAVTLDFPKGVVKKKSSKQKVWNLNAEGYAKFRELSEKSITVNPGSNTNSYYENWLAKLLSLMGECFSKKTVGGGSNQALTGLSNCRKNIRRILQTESRKGKIQRLVVKKYLEILKNKEIQRIQRKKAASLKKTISLLTEEEKFSPEGYWKLKKSVSKGKEKTKIMSVVCNGNVEVTGDKLIKEEYRKEFEFRLRNRVPHNEWKQYTENVNEILKILLASEYTETPLFTLDELKKAILKLKKGKSPGHDRIPAEIFLNAGTGLLEELLKVLNQIKVTKDVPEQFNWVDITTIFKNKGSKKELVNYRGIFLTIIVKKILENMVKDRMKDQLDKINKLQGGARSNRSPPDNLFLLYACRDHQVYKNRPLYLTAYDFEQAFDSLWLQDCILSLQDLGVPLDILHLIYNLNKEAKFTVKTPYGATNQTVVRDIVEQGTVLGPVLCSTSTAEYCGTNTGVAVLDTIVSSLLWVDDTADLSTCKLDAEESHENAVLFGRKKKSPYSKKKCKTMVINGKKKDLPADLFIENVKLEVTQKIVYLGDVVNSKGTNSDLIADRIQRGTSAMIRAEALVRETSLGVYTISVHLLLYQSLFLSSMTFNSQAWSNLKESDIKELEKLQLKCLKKILQVPGSTTNSFTFLEFGQLPVRYIVHRNQLNFLHHIVHLDEDDPVKRMWESQRKLNGEKNWWYGVEMSMQKYAISLDDVRLKSKDSFKEYTRKKIREAALSDLTKECYGKTKTKNLRYETLNPQSYLSRFYPKQAKAIFQARSSTLDIKEHRPYRFKDLKCRLCHKEDETLQHIVNCGKEDVVDSTIVFNDRTWNTACDELLLISLRIVNFLDNVSEDNGQ